jgi:hypothetical protein
MGGSFRNTASFGKRIEYWIIGLLLKDGFDVFIPLVDDDGIDAIIRHENGRKIDLQIKARSKDVSFGDAALFGPLPHEAVREGYFFLFYAERMETMWLMSSQDFIAQSVSNKNGKHVGKRSIWLNGRSVKSKSEHCRPQFLPWCISDDGQHRFGRLSAYFETGTDPVGAAA